MSAPDPILDLRAVTKGFASPRGWCDVLRGVDLLVRPGEFVVITGPSGSGKTTLLNLIGLLDCPDTGVLRFEGREIVGCDETERCFFRVASLGVVFQRFCLLAHRSVLDNVLFRFRYGDTPDAEARRCALDALARVGLAPLSDTPARVLSAGEMQRVAIARAIAARPRLLLADEPTGNLDRVSAESVMDCFHRLHRDGMAVIMVTHNESLIEGSTRHLILRDGALAPAAANAVTLGARGSDREAVNGAGENCWCSEAAIQAGGGRAGGPCGSAPQWRGDAHATRRRGRRHFTRALGDAWEGLRSRPGRAWLAVLAILVGMAALTMLLAVLGGLQRQAQDMIHDLGANGFALVPAPGYRSTTGGSGLRVDHARLLRANLPECRIAAVRRFDCRIEGFDAPLPVIGVEPALAKVRPFSILRGRFLDDRDERNLERAAVVSAGVARDRGWGVGSLVDIDGTPFSIVGVWSAGTGGPNAPAGAAQGLYGTAEILVPLAVAALWLDGAGTDSRRADAILARAPRHGDASRFAALARRLVECPDACALPVASITPGELVRDVRRVQRVIAAVAGSAVALCIALGGTALMGLMTAGVRERFPEIGLRRALGASRRDIAGLFVLESCLLTGSAAVTAIASVHLALIVLGARLHVPTATGPYTLLVPLCTALVLGALFAWLPARLAASLSPADALRSD